MNHQWDDTELIVFITPHIVVPRGPVQDEVDRHDILSIAGPLMPDRFEDGQTGAITKYFNEKQYRGHNAVEKTKDAVIPAVPKTPAAVASTLDDFEAQLRWEKK